MELTAVVGLTVVAALLSVLLRDSRPEQGLLLRLGAGTAVLLAVLSQLSPLLSGVQEMLSKSSLSWEYSRLLFKGLGICLLTQTAADTCRDAGETALAGKVELSSKITLLLLAVPLFEKVAELAIAMIDGRTIT
ncbi:MAG: stage III sporulation protein AD [Clostridia bacterium]|nr:stage III sporulation protein AD [Clostridia bacterium]